MAKKGVGEPEKRTGKNLKKPKRMMVREKDEFCRCNERKWVDSISAHECPRLEVL